MPKTPVTSTRVDRVEAARVTSHTDLVAVEEPLEIVLEHGPAHARKEAPLALTMRTPGHDADLALGFLFAEGVIDGRGDVVDARHCVRAEVHDNVMRVVLAPDVVVPTRLLERNLKVTSACGVCGAKTIEALHQEGCTPVANPGAALDAEVIRGALSTLEASQPCFRHTGGTHGAALFDYTGDVQVLREDVGRHNAFDKVMGHWLGQQDQSNPHFVVLSSRASFELVQKAVRGGFPVLVAVGAASSLAIETAREFGVTLIGFAREGRFNIYSGGDRVAVAPQAPDFARIGAL